ncbi:hypothetical protein MMYC01_201915 [Madurella mycetomatis]|uniref:Uncharacterized protein n=1 Tax=Madurella mycetomatis TaxID=100816 RepID=A0A175VZP5_9PEZI|nr:hypothetical protein MMYC01_207046 [Madurella mycetomatis]KXX81296.1 hypothetical protein MMYC01_201915 [Madurella mycetomatis]
MGIKGCGQQGESGEEAVVVPLQPAGTAEVGEGVLLTGSLAHCELQVHVPLDTDKLEGDYEFALVQEWEGSRLVG